MYKRAGISILMGLLALGSAHAEDVEIYTDTEALGVRPNVLFVMDTSGSMGGEVDVSTYDPAVTYSVPGGEDACQTDRVYVGGIYTTHPDCDTDYWFDRALLRCKAAETNLDMLNTGVGTGYFVDRIARWNSNYDNWYSLHSTFYYYRPESTHYECRDDDQVHGETDASTQLRIRNGTSGPWSTTISSNIWNSKNSRTLFTGNYLNWYHYHGGSTGLTKTRLEIVVEAATSLISSITDINLGLMRFNTYSYNTAPSRNKGGPVRFPIVDLDDSLDGGVTTNRQAMINELQSYTDQGYTPLTETVYEGLRYFRGETLLNGVVQPDGSLGSHAAAQSGGAYISPIEYDCGANYMIVFTDGEPTYDGDVDTQVNTLISGNSGDMGTCGHGGNYSAVDSCLDELANYMYTADHADDTVGPADLPGLQNITSYYIGGFDAANDTLLDDAAARGGTEQAYSASNPSEFAAVFSSIIGEILQVNAAFTSPAVSVNALNRLRHNNDLYFALFEPTREPHWNGNIKKYRLESTGSDTDGDGEPDVFIADRSSNPAVNESTGLFEETARSYWSRGVDGDLTSEGGSAHRLFDYDTTGAPDDYDATSREFKVFTYLNDYEPDDFNGNGETLINIHESNADATITGEDFVHITKTTLGLSDSMPDAEFLDRVMWARGVDVLDEDGDGLTTDGRPVLGGVLHTEPLLVNYAISDNGTPNDDSDDTQTNVVFVTTNDGYFHILKSEDSSPGNDDTSQNERLEHTAIMPKQTLELVDELYVNTGTDVAYRLDSNIDIWRVDGNDDDQITTSGFDHVYAYIGQRRGGNAIFAFDLTDPDLPKLLWVIDPDNVPTNSNDPDIGPFQYMGQTWSRPKHHKILVENAAGTALEEKDIVIFGGGYDNDKDDIIDTTRDVDDLGNAIYIVDAQTGELLWWASTSASLNVTPTYSSGDMDYGFASDIKIVDINGDGFADKFFGTDGGGQVWRFDINNQLNVGDPLALSNRITGGVIADLQLDNSGGSQTTENNRRLYYAPDVAIIQVDENTAPFLSIAVGTGYRAHPLNKTIVDKFVLLKYSDVLSIPSDYSAEKLYLDDLLDVTNLNFASSTPPTLTPTEETNLYENGWYIEFDPEGSTDPSGEKSLSESVTVDGKIVFTTYTPPTDDGNTGDDQECAGNQGAGKTYVVSALDASPVANLDQLGAVGDLQLTDRSYNLKVSGIPPRPKVIFPDLDDVSGKIIVGRELLPVNLDNPPELTYWLQN